MHRRVMIAAAVAAGLLLLGAPAALAGGGGGGGPCAGFSEGAEVVLRDMCLDGTAQFAPAGRDLEVINNGAIQHDLVAVGGAFETELLQPDERTVVPSPDPGIYRVYCTLHGTADGGGMAGVLVVGDAAQPADAPAAGLVQASTVPIAETASVPHPATWWAAAAATIAVLIALASLALTIRQRRAE